MKSAGGWSTGSEISAILKAAIPEDGGASDAPARLSIARFGTYRPHRGVDTSRASLC